MVAVTARMAAGLQVEAQASLDSRKHDNERQTDRKPGQGRTPIAREVRAACVVALQEDDAALSKAGIHTALGSVYPALPVQTRRQCALRRGLREPAAAPVVCAQVPPGMMAACASAYVRCARSKAAIQVASTAAATMSANARV